MGLASFRLSSLGGAYASLPVPASARAHTHSYIHRQLANILSVPYDPKGYER